MSYAVASDFYDECEICGENLDDMGFCPYCDDDDLLFEDDEEGFF